ncbi:MAG: hypothetical protein V3V00_02350 [Saprospiraceae bacterium]
MNIIKSLQLKIHQNVYSGEKSITQLSKELGINRKSITRCASGGNCTARTLEILVNYFKIKPNNL